MGWESPRDIKSEQWPHLGVGAGEGKGVQGTLFLYTLVRSEFLTTNILYFCVPFIHFFQDQEPKLVGQERRETGSWSKLSNPSVRKQIL